MQPNSRVPAPKQGILIRQHFENPELLISISWFFYRSRQINTAENLEIKE
jgi:hypothetical protein